jgi:hypothetical protein
VRSRSAERTTAIFGAETTTRAVAGVVLVVARRAAVR